MAGIISGYINVSKLDKSKFKKSKNGDMYYYFTMSVENETDEYGNNCGIYDEQSKEQREAKERRDYRGNGKVVWTDGSMVKFVKQDKPGKPPGKPEPFKVEEESDDDLPF